MQKLARKVLTDGMIRYAALPPRGQHHRALLGVSDGDGGYDECCCRFDSLCARMQAADDTRRASPPDAKPRPVAPVPEGKAKKKTVAKATGRTAARGGG